ncbi:MAG: CvpA family protein [bacterium]|nr:CvpA family protein [bacterium]
MPAALKEIIVDLIIVGVLLFFIYRGFKRGFIKEFMSFFGILVSLILAVRYMSTITAALYGALELPQSIVTVIAFLIIFIPVMLLFRWVSKKLKLISRFSFTLGNLDRIAGITIGLIKGAIFISICTMVISLSNLSMLFRQEVQSSQLFRPMKQVLPLAYSVTRVFVWQKYKSFYMEMQESLSAKSKAVMDQKAEDYIRDFEGK